MSFSHIILMLRLTMHSVIVSASSLHHLQQICSVKLLYFQLRQVDSVNVRDIYNDRAPEPCHEQRYATCGANVVGHDLFVKLILVEFCEAS